MLHKQPIRGPSSRIPRKEIAISKLATLLATSESPSHSINCICDGRSGPGGTRWIADEPGDQTVVLTFDTPCNLHKISLEVEEQRLNRTQELDLAISRDGGLTYRDVIHQEYKFSPSGKTFEHEEWRIPAKGVTNVWVWIRPDKDGKPCRASITSLALE
jgi:hypothetical protein